MESINKITGLMKISSNKPKVSLNTKTKPYGYDTFERTISFKGKMNETELLKKEYGTLSSEEKDFLRNIVDDGTKETVNECLNAAKNIIKNYDEKFGKNNWEYVSIGRSCSPIADVLEKLGIKTYTIPISGLQSGVESIEDLTKQNGFEDYKQFIYNLGLNPNTLKDSTKTFVFQDFADKGTTIKVFEDLIRSDDMGLNFKNVFFESINKALEDGFEFCESREEAKSLINLPSKLASQNTLFSLKKFTAIPKLDWHNLSEIKKLLPKDSYDSNLFKFILSDILG